MACLKKVWNSFILVMMMPANLKWGIWYDGSMQISYPVQPGASKIEVQDH